MSLTRENPLEHVLTLSLFRAWLQSYGKGLVGEPHSETGCPVCRWVRARIWPQAVIVFGWVRPIPGAAWEPLPDWSRAFEEAACDAVQPGRSLTAVRALALLKRVAKETANA